MNKHTETTDNKNNSTSLVLLVNPLLTCQLEQLFK